MKVGRLKRNAGIVLAAGAAGAAIALPFAPQSGAWTRRMIVRKTEDVAHGVREAYKWIKDNGNGAARTLAYRLRLKVVPRIARESLGG